jgi:hypothetical protein
MANGSTAMGTGSATKFVGVYSGRTGTNDPNDAQLGLTWPAAFVQEIVTSKEFDQNL